MNYITHVHVTIPSWNITLLVLTASLMHVDVHVAITLLILTASLRSKTERPRLVSRNDPNKHGLRDYIQYM